MTIEELMKQWSVFLTLYATNNVFKHNIELLSQMPLELWGQKISCETIKNAADLNSRGELNYDVWHPQILNTYETVKFLLENPTSFCRFGDGEFQIMMGNSIPFQEYNRILAGKLLTIIKSKGKNCMIGLPGSLFCWPRENTAYHIDWYLKNRLYFIEFINKCANKEHGYINTEFTCNYIGTKNSEMLNSVYDMKLKLFSGRKMVIFAGDNILKNLKNNVFEKAKSLEIINCPKKNSFAVHEQILEKARTYSKEQYTIGLILGPTATALAWDLSQEGYLAWDLGHIAKDYEAYCLDMEKVKKNIINFLLQTD